MSKTHMGWGGLKRANVENGHERHRIRGSEMEKTDTSLLMLQTHTAQYLPIKGGRGGADRCPLNLE